MAKPQTETERRLSDVVEKEFHRISDRDRYPDTKAKLRLCLTVPELRCLAIMVAEAVVRGDKHIKLTCKRKKPKVIKPIPRALRTVESRDDYE